MNHQDHWLFEDYHDQAALDAHEQELTAFEEAVLERDRAFELRDEGIERAGRGADPIWVEEALEAVKAVAYCSDTLTSEDVADQINRATHEPRALGSIMRCAADRGWIVATDAWTPARNPVAHRRPMRVWRSLIKAEDVAA